MADLLATDLIYTVVDQDIEDKNRVNVFKITTPAGEYPTGGLPLTNGKLGVPNRLIDLVIIEPDAGNAEFTYRYDDSANTIKVFEEDGTSGVTVEHANATFASPDELIVKVRGW